MMEEFDTSQILILILLNEVMWKLKLCGNLWILHIIPFQLKRFLIRCLGERVNKITTENHQLEQYRRLIPVEHEFIIGDEEIGSAH